MTPTNTTHEDCPEIESLTLKRTKRIRRTGFVHYVPFSKNDSEALGIDQGDYVVVTFRRPTREELENQHQRVEQWRKEREARWRQRRDEGWREPPHQD